MKIVSHHLIFASATIALCAAAASANSQAPAEPSAAASRGLMQDRSSSSEAEALYVEKCSMCHRRMGMGTVLLSRRIAASEAELENRDNLTAPYVILAARRGIGNMPPIPPGEVSDQELEVIAQYLVKSTAE